MASFNFYLEPFTGNDLKELPSSLAGFENLQSFVGAQNGFHSSVLVALGALPSLKDVQLGYNAIDGIPEDLEGKNCFPELQVCLTITVQ